MDKSPFIESASACLANGERLLVDAEMLEFEEPPCSSFVLAIIAQEEFAKGFLLFLVSRDVIAWNTLVYRATQDHTCKQLLGIVIEHMNPEDEEFFRRSKEWRIKIDEHRQLLYSLRKTRDAEEQDRIWARIKAISESWDLLPRTVADAINIFRHEKIGRWESSGWVWAEEPVYDKLAEQIAKGKLDREKQDALYVRLDKQGRVIRTPQGITPEHAKQARERANRMGWLLKGLLAEGPGSARDYEKIESAFRAVFASLAERNDVKVGGS